VDRSHPAWGRVEGVAILDVTPGSRAARAGLEPGDVITAVNRQPVGTVRDLGRALGDAPGTVALTVWRDGRLMLIVFRP
jgi:S1-C subfamily serine protease